MTVREPLVRDPAGALYLLVVCDDMLTTHPLPAHGQVVIGRSHDADVHIDHSSISRSHAMLTIGEQMTVEDLGSLNGTAVRDRRLEPGELAAVSCGEVIYIGSVVVIIQQRDAPLRQRRLWTHGYFEARLEEECARAARRRSTFVVAKLRCDQAAPANVVEEALGDVLGAAGLIGYYAPGEYEALLVDADDQSAPALLEELARRMEAAGITLSVGVALYPRDGQDPVTLDNHARAAARASRDPAAEATLHGPASAMVYLQQLANRIAASTISVMLLGETGVGKEVLAASVHQNSLRRDKPYLRLNCAALSESLLESELFGHERGSFTGATRDKPGLLETAQGGTVFLDEVGELPLSLQVKLLRVIENREVTRVGALRPTPLDVRFISATNRDLEAAIAAGRFRRDLFFRLNGIVLVIPPLRERRDEIEGLALRFLADAARQLGRPRLHVTAEAMEELRSHSWPGNIRELRNVVERAAVLAGGEEILPEHLTLEPAAAPPPETFEDVAPQDTVETIETFDAARQRLKRNMEEVERKRILEALEKSVGNQTEAARLLQISRRTLVNKLEKFGIRRPRKH